MGAGGLQMPCGIHAWGSQLGLVAHWLVSGMQPVMGCQRASQAAVLPVGPLLASLSALSALLPQPESRAFQLQAGIMAPAFLWATEQSPEPREAAAGAWTSGPAPEGW